MTIPFIGQRPADNQLTQIAANIRQIANPNWEMQLEMQRRMMADPNLVSQLAEVERNAPGTIAKMGFGRKLTDIIVNTPETFKQKSQRELTALQLQDAKNNLEEFNMKKVTFEQEQADYAKRLAGIEAFKKFDIGKETQNFVAGKPSNQFLQALQEAGNEAQQIFMANVQNLSGIRRLEQEHSLAMTRIAAQERMAEARERRMLLLNDAREDKAYKRMLNQNAFDSWQKAGVGSAAAWRDVMDMEGDGNRRMQELMKNPLAARNEKDRELLTIGQYLQSNQQSGIELRKKQLLGEARKEMVTAQNKSLKKEEVAPFVNNINQYYAGIRQLDPNFNLSVRQDGKNIQLIDENTGLAISDESQAVNVTRLPLPVDKTTKQPVALRIFLDDAVAEWKARDRINFSGESRSAYATKFKRTYGNELFNLFWKRVQED